MNVYPVARLPDKWLEAGRAEGAHVDVMLKSPWQLFASFDGDDAGGFIGLLLVSETRAHIRGWYVFPEWRKQGIGTQLLEHAVAWASTHGIETLKIYTAHDVAWAGFAPTGKVRVGGNKEREWIRQQSAQGELPL